MTAPTHSESVEYVPTQAMRTFTQVLLHPDTKGNKSEVERITRIRRDRFNWNLRHNVQFRLWFEAQCDRALMSIRPEVDSSLFRQIKDGVVPAMRTYYEVIGKIKNRVTQAVNIDARDTQLEVNVYPQFDIIFQDVIPANGNELTIGDDTSDKDGVHAVEGSGSTLKRLPL